MIDHPRRRPRHSRSSPYVLERINPHAAGIDCGAAAHFVAVPPDRDPTPVRSFKTFTTDLHNLADWLETCRVTSVAMEAMGVYWIPIYEILEARGIAVHLVNAPHVRKPLARPRRRQRFAFVEHCALRFALLSVRIVECSLIAWLTCYRASF